MLVKAYQIAPELQESPLFMGEWPENIFVYGNKYFTDRSGRLAGIREALEYIADAFEELQRGGYNDGTNANLHAVIWYYLPRDNGAGYTRAERLRIVDLAREYTYNMDFYTADLALLEALEIVTGEKYERATIRGCCQSDWNIMVYPAEYGDEWRDAFEAEYFNTGEEWRIDDGSGDEYYFYSHHWNDDGKRAEIAAAAGCKPEDVELYAFSGWTRTPEYREVLV